MNKQELTYVIISAAIAIIIGFALGYMVRSCTGGYAQKYHQCSYSQRGKSRLHYQQMMKEKKEKELKEKGIATEEVSTPPVAQPVPVKR